MEVYFNMHEVTWKKKIFFVRLTWWESDAVSRALGNEPPMIDWDVFKDMIKSQFYPIGYEEHQQIVWHYFRHRQGQSLSEFTIEFKKREIQMGFTLKSPDMLVNYLGEFLPHIHKQFMLFRPKMIDEASIQAQ